MGLGRRPKRADRDTADLLLEAAPMMWHEPFSWIRGAYDEGTDLQESSMTWLLEGWSLA